MQANGVQQRQQEQAYFHSFTEPIVEKAIRLTKQATKGKTRPSRRADISEDRLEERQSRRQTEASMPRKANALDESAEVISIKSTKIPKTPDAANPVTNSMKDKLHQKRLEMIGAPNAK